MEGDYKFVSCRDIVSYSAILVDCDGQHSHNNDCCYCAAEIDDIVYQSVISDHLVWIWNVVDSHALFDSNRELSHY